MDCEQQQRKIFECDQQTKRFVWLQKNEFQRLVSGFVHDQNAKVKLGMKNERSAFKIEEKLVKSGKSYEVNGTFWTWNILSDKMSSPTDNVSFANKLIEKPSLVFGACKNNLKLEWRVGQRVYKKFRYNPFISLQTPKDLNDLSVTLGLIHKSESLNLLTKLTSSIMNSADFIYKSRIEYAKNQMYVGFSSEITPGFNFKVNKSLLGYEFSPRDYFYLRFQTQNISQLIKGKQTYQQLSFYYLKKLNENLKFALGLKSVNSNENSLNLIVETKVPYHIKGKIDSKLNVCLTVKKQFNQFISFSYGIAVTNLFQKRSRIQTGMVLEYNA